MNSLLEALARLLADEEALAHSVLHVRVVESAIPGSMVAVPAFPEGAPAALRRIFGEYGGERARLEAKVASFKEIAIHPDDWAEILVEINEIAEKLDLGPVEGVDRVWGVDVVE